MRLDSLLKGAKNPGFAFHSSSASLSLAKPLSSSSPLSPRGISPIAPEGGGEGPEAYSALKGITGRRAESYFLTILLSDVQKAWPTVSRDHLTEIRLAKKKYFPGYLCEDKNDHSWER